MRVTRTCFKICHVNRMTLGVFPFPCLDLKSCWSWKSSKSHDNLRNALSNRNDGASVRRLTNATWIQWQIKRKLLSHRFSCIFSHRQHLSSLLKCYRKRRQHLRPHTLLDPIDEAGNVCIYAVWACKSTELPERRDSDDFVHAIRLAQHNLRKSKRNSFREWNETRKNFSTLRYAKMIFLLLFM